MPLRSLIAALVLAMCGLVGVGFAQPTSSDGAGDGGPSPGKAAKVAEARSRMRQALKLLERNRVEQATEQLRELAARSDDGGTKYLAGLVSAQVAGTFAKRQARWRESPVVDAVVLVPDARSFYAAIDRWRDGPMFPVLIEDGWWAPMFVRAFEPERVVRWSAPEADGEAEQSRGLIEPLLDAHERSLNRRGQDDPTPPGLVVLDPDHAHAPAAAALAIGRHQRVLQHQPDRKALGSVEGVSRFNDTVMRHAAESGLVASDAWFGITLAGDYPIKIKHEKETLAFDDVIGRDSRGLRLAVVGRLQGSGERAVYQAMCSLFLQPRRALLVDDYSNRDKGIFVAYRFDDAAAILDRRLEVNHLTGDQASAARLHRLQQQADPFGMVWINSSGGSTSFALRGGAGRPGDLPAGYPTAYYVVHSFSAQNVGSPATIAGRALHNGAYWYFGSVHEPYLHAFVRPTGLAVKAMAGTPLAVAARHTPGHPMHRPWKLTLVGDPLFTLRDEPAKRVAKGLPDDAAAVSAEAADSPAQRFRNALLSDANGVADLAEQAIERADDLPAGDRRSAAWLLIRAGRMNVLARHVDAGSVRREPLLRDALGDHAFDRFEAAREAGDYEAARAALERLLQLSTDRRRMTEAVRGLVVEAAKRGRDDALVAELREKAGDKSTPRHARRAIRKALPEPAEAGE